jgi:hypothetical protein
MALKDNGRTKAEITFRACTGFLGLSCSGSGEEEAQTLH